MPKTLIKPLKVILLLMILVSNALQGLAQTPAGEKTFKVFDATLYANKPDLSAYGLAPITVVYPDSFGRDWYRQSNQELPRKVVVQAVAKSVEAGRPCARYRALACVGRETHHPRELKKVHDTSGMDEGCRP